jgi:hypothetical protein
MKNKKTFQIFSAKNVHKGKIKYRYYNYIIKKFVGSIFENYLQKIT